MNQGNSSNRGIISAEAIASAAVEVLAMGDSGAVPEDETVFAELGSDVDVVFN